MPVEVGKVIEGIVTGITNFGAFVQLEKGKTGLVHISEISDSYVKDINNHLKVQDKVKVKVLSIDKDGKISLSIKQAQPKKSKRNPYQWSGTDQPQTKGLNFEDQLSKFIKESDERQQSLKKSFDSKRGGSYKKGQF
ncbi:S1 domain-containing RNA-binding protein [Irregularibacter muris]|uniref:S1 domain-containing RNA-binding protein n=1 Tax=Irregularibacter muris TaxID=1796619 RepID=A0AAE3KZD3_9FIRM|nr:S1 domain-containing RNA-binding protein [Irregularibacter muris]MCR1899040.1 S1 domain-containing RNA-binding protein [Irregularibacter muris]